MAVSEFSIKRPVTTMMIMISMVIMGVLALSTLKTQLLPNFNIPAASVSVTWTGASPNDMEKLVTDEIEDALTGVEDIKEISTESTMGSSQVFIEFEYGVDVDEKVNDVVTEISRIRGLLPDEINEPVIRKQGMSSDMVMVSTVSGEDLIEIKSFAENIMKPRLERIGGMGDINIYGGYEKEVLIEIDPDKLEAYGMTTSELYQVVKSSSINFPSGYIREGDKELLVKVMGEVETLEDVQQIVVKNDGRQPLFLSDVANVRIDVKDRTRYGRTGGKDNVIMMLEKTDMGNAVVIAEEIMKAYDELEEQLPNGSSINIVFNAAEDINASIGTVTNNALTGLVLACVVLLIFLKDLRAMFIVGIAIPVSVIATFMFFGAKGMTLNLISLMGLSLGIGMLVDNSIVVLDNIYRHLTELKKPRMEAARDGASEVVIPIIASTATTVAVFLPLVLRDGLAKEIFQDMSYSIVFSLLASLIVAITFVPMISSRILNEKTRIDKEGIILRNIKKVYGKVLGGALRFRAVVIALIIILFVGVMNYGTKNVGGTFMPVTDDGTYTVIGKMPKGLDVKKVNRLAGEFEKIVATHKNTLSYTTFASKDDFSIMVDIGDVDEREKGDTVFKIVEDIRGQVEDIPDTYLNIVPKFQRGSGGKDLSVELKSDDVNQLKEASSELLENMRGIEGLTDLENSMTSGNPEARLELDRTKLAYYGISVMDLTFAISYQILGGAPVTIKDGTNELDVTLRLAREYRESSELLMDSRIETNNGQSVKLSDIATLVVEEGAASIDKKDGIRTLELMGNIADGYDLVTIQKLIVEEIEKMNLPKNISYEFGGDGGDLKDVMGQLIFAFSVAIFLIYFILASQFESYALPIIVMGTVPLSVTGVYLGLIITGEKTNIMVFVGIIMLAGIVVNNAIVLIDYINLLRERGHEVAEAIKIAGQTRLRPIIMTTMTTVCGMIPLSLGLGQGSEMYKGMAIAVIFGLSFSTILTLIFIPVLYSLYESFLAGIMRLRRGIKKSRIKKEKQTEVEAMYKSKKA